MDKKYYIYVILTKDNTLYCGYTDDVEKRFDAHMSGKGAKYTRAHKPLKILYTACFDTKSEAMAAEREFKSLDREQKLKFLKSVNVKV